MSEHAAAAPPASQRSILQSALEQGLLEWSLVLAGVLLIASAPPQIVGDGSLRLESLTHLLRDHTLDATKYSLLGPLLAAPLWALGKTEFFNLVVFCLAIVALRALLGPLLGARGAARFALVALCASTLPHDLHHFYGEPFTAFASAVGLAALATGSMGILASGTLIVAGAINTPAVLVGTGLACAYLAWRTRSWKPLLIPALALAGILLEGYLRRGALFASGYDGDHGYQNDLPFSGEPGFSYPFLLGIASLIFSFGRGLLFFYPALFLPLPGPSARRTRTLHTAWVLFVVGLLLVYAKWWAWYGGIWFGPRFFLFAAMPAALALVIRADHESSPLATVATWLAGTLAFWLGFTALAFGDRVMGMGICHAAQYRFEPLCWYAPEFSPFAAPFLSSRNFTSRELLAAAFCGVAYLVALAPLHRRLVRVVVSSARASIAAVMSGPADA